MSWNNPAFFSAGQIVTIEKFAKSHDVYALTIIELATISVLGFAGIFVAGEAVPQALTGLELGTLILLGLVCSALCFILQTTAQKHVAANRVALILTVEPVVGAAASVMILHETLGIVGWLGGLLVVVSIVLSEWSPDPGPKLENDAE